MERREEWGGNLCGLFRVWDDEPSEDGGETTGAMDETEEGAGGVGVAEEVDDVSAAVI